MIGYVVAGGATTLDGDTFTTGGLGAGGGEGGSSWSLGIGCGAGFSGVGAAIAIVGICDCRGTISLTLSTFAFDVGVGVRELSNEIPRPTANVVALLKPLPGLSVFLSLDSLLLDELLLLLLPLSLPLRLLPGRITINPDTTPPPCSGALTVITLSLAPISPVIFFFFSFFPSSTCGVLGVAAGVCCILGVSNLFRRDVDCEAVSGVGCCCCCLFDGLRLCFSDFAESAGDL